MIQKRFFQFCLLAALCLTSLRASAQDPGVLKVSPLSLFFKTIVVHYEQPIQSHFSAQATLGYTTRIKANLGTWNASAEGFMFRLEGRYYPTGNAPTGFYLGGYVPIHRYTLRQDVEHSGRMIEAKGHLTRIGIGGAVGAQFALGEHLTLDLNAGLGLGGSTLKLVQGERDDLKTPFFDLLLPRIGIALGWHF